MRRSLAFDAAATTTLRELHGLGMMERIPQKSLEELLSYQKSTGKSLAKILANPWWCRRLGLSPTEFNVTWYMSNPFDVLPADLQAAIRATEEPSFRNRRDVREWCEKKKASQEWMDALEAAFIETTPYNLWRASRGLKPYAFNGEFLEPIVVDRGRGHLEVRNGHMATDPEFIPTNMEVIVLVKIQGEERLLKIKAADTGSAIKGRHVDLPIRLYSRTAVPLPKTRFPAEHIHNPSVLIFMPPARAEKTVSPGRKA